MRLYEGGGGGGASALIAPPLDPPLVYVLRTNLVVPSIRRFRLTGEPPLPDCNDNSILLRCPPPRENTSYSEHSKVRFHSCTIRESLLPTSAILHNNASFLTANTQSVISCHTSLVLKYTLPLLHTMACNLIAESSITMTVMITRLIRYIA